MKKRLLSFLRNQVSRASFTPLRAFSQPTRGTASSKKLGLRWSPFSTTASKAPWFASPTHPTSSSSSGTRRSSQWITTRHWRPLSSASRAGRSSCGYIRGWGSWASIKESCTSWGGNSSGLTKTKAGPYPSSFLSKCWRRWLATMSYSTTCEIFSVFSQ